MSQENKSKLTTLVVAVIFVTFMAGCDERPQLPLRADSKSLGEYGEYTGTHLIVRWPKREHSKEDDSVTLKIPVEYLNEGAVAKDKKGISRIYIDFTMPGVTPWVKLPLPNGQPEVVEAWQKHLRTRVLVILDRESGANYIYNTRILQENSGYLRDGSFAGLERYTRKFCYKPEEMDLPNTKGMLLLKQPDDKTPANCLMDRRDSIYQTPPETTSGNNGVFIRMTTGDAYISAAGRLAKVFLLPEDLSNWKERVESARKLIDGFVVPNGGRIS